MEIPTPPTPPVLPKDEQGSIRIKRSTVFLVLGGALIIWLLFFWKPWGEAPTVKSPGTSNPTFKRDEPTKPQIFQSDYEEKIKDLLNQGKSVAEISNETGVSRKEIRRIKKAMGKGDSDN